MRNRLFGALVVTVAGISLTACGAAGYDSADAPDTTVAQAASASPDIAVSESSLGPIVVDAQGRTLYAFTKDSAGTSACYDQCAVTWPIVNADEVDAIGNGIDRSALGSITRTDGVKQLTLKGVPLYRFAADTAPGDVKGQNNKGVWFVVRADGTLVKGSTTTTTAKTGYTYSY